MSSLSPRHALSYLHPSQAQKHVTVNESLRLLDAVLHCAVLSVAVAEEPADPQEGEAWILPENRSGPAWGQIPPGHVAAFQDGAFAAIAPVAGFLAYVRDSGRFVLFDGARWSPLALSPDRLPALGVNAAADAVNRLSVKSDAELLSHDDVTPGSGDARKVINKKDAGRTASVLFQTGFSGRAEIGLVGDDALAFKVSADGRSFTEVLRADAATGNLAVRRTGAQRAVHVGGPVSPGIRMQLDGSTGYGELFTANAGQTLLSHVAPAGVNALIDLAPMPTDGTSSASFRFFRGTETTHGCYLTIHVGNNTAAYNHQFSGKWDSYIQASSGNVRVGSNVPPVCKLDVAGPVRVAGYTVSTLPSATAGAGQIVYVSNEAGGAVLAFSDGTNWRRVTDRAVVS